LFSGCDRSVGPDSASLNPKHQVIAEPIITDFDEGPRLVSSQEGLRVGSYFDIRPYDSLQISFREKRISSVKTADRLLMRIGPAFYLCDTISSPEEEERFSVISSLISKRSFCAFSFMVPDSGVVFQLSELRVIGWKTE
jgi:hypothetical protein